MKQVEIRGSYDPLTEDDLVTLEKKWGFTLPNEYRRFLLAHNGGRPTPRMFPIKGNAADDRGIVNNFLGIQEGKSNNLLDYMETYRGRLPANLIPIARDPGGNVICLSVSGSDRGKVYFWDHEEESEEGEPPTYENIYEVADSFNDLLNDLTD